MLWSLLASTRSHVIVLKLERQTDFAEPVPLTAMLIFLLRTHQLQLHRSTASAPHVFTSNLNIFVLIRFHPVLCMFLVAGARALHELSTLDIVQDAPVALARGSTPPGPPHSLHIVTALPLSVAGCHLRWGRPRAGRRCGCVLHVRDASQVASP